MGARTGRGRKTAVDELVGGRDRAAGEPNAPVTRERVRVRERECVALAATEDVEAGVVDERGANGVAIHGAVMMHDMPGMTRCQG